MSYGLPQRMARPDEEKLIGHTHPALLMYLQAAAILPYAKLDCTCGIRAGAPWT
jgi:hypothetical protein